MTAATDLFTSEREAIKQYADWYSHQGYQVSVEPSPRELPEFLRALAPDIIARRNGENIVVEIKTSSPASFEQVQRLARALEHRAGWKLQVVYADLVDPEWTPPSELPEISELLTRLATVGSVDEGDHSSPQFLLLWSIIEAAARHRLSSLKIPPTRRISSSALLKMLLTEGIIEDDDYAVLRRGLAVRNAIAHGFLNQPVDAALFEELRNAARLLLRAVSRK
jgi:REase_AHJR-like